MFHRLISSKLLGQPKFSYLIKPSIYLLCTIMSKISFISILFQSRAKQGILTFQRSGKDSFIVCINGNRQFFLQPFSLQTQALRGFTYFDNAKQLTRHLGLSPTYQQSGTSVNFKGHINRNGDSSLRSQLYVAAFASLRCNTECRACYDRLRSNGKPGKVAIIAVANKLIRQAFAVVTQEKPYVDGYISSKK